MAKFKLGQRVKKIGTNEVRTVEEISDGSGEPLYSIQLGSDSATRISVKESELEAVPESSGEAADGRQLLHISRKDDEALLDEIAGIAEELGKNSHDEQPS